MIVCDVSFVCDRKKPCSSLGFTHKECKGVRLTCRKTGIRVTVKCSKFSSVFKAKAYAQVLMIALLSKTNQEEI